MTVSLGLALLLILGLASRQFTFRNGENLPHSAFEFLRRPCRLESAWTLARANHNSICGGLQDMSSELIKTGTLEVHDWGCEIPYMVRRIRLEETLPSPGSDSEQFDQLRPAEENRESECEPILIGEHQPQSESKAAPLGSALP
jgi:hypothetical protein